ncbi:MAG: RNA polymerase sigma factor [Gemmatimonadaceae bacterium]|nr:RNA polymerase sigma factor [Gemmatimonadaceae bacterium]MCC6429730.1 RNA polymerase sigma factor [Gemmatimonadaceae bacterium]
MSDQTRVMDSALDDDDRNRLRSAAGGNTSAFDAIVERHEAAVARFLRTLGGDEIDDALQETFIAAWRSAGAYNGTGTVRSWLLSIARNVHRHSKRRRVDEPSTFVPLDALAERAGWGCDPAEPRRMDAALARDEVERALAMLPDDEREVLVLRELEELSGDETARLLGLSLPAMKSRLHRARIHLAAALRGNAAAESPAGRLHVRD